MSAHAPTAFISYSREDSEFVLRLAEDLRAVGARVWLDQLDIEPGQAWDSAVEKALVESGRMLLVLSPASAASKNVRNEMSFALEENKVINLVSKKGVQLAAIGYPDLSRDEMYHQLENFYKRFYFRPSKIWEILREMLTSWDMMKRRLREGVEFFRFLRAHEA